MQNPSAGKTALGLDTNVGAGICYVGNLVCALGLIYSIIVVATDKTNKLTRFHAFQSIFLTLASIPLTILYMVGFGIAIAIDSALGFPLFFFLVWLIVLILGLAVFVGMIYSAIKAFQGEIFKLPIIGNLADQYSN
jgi:uncharacterized membrane protein